MLSILRPAAVFAAAASCAAACVAGSTVTGAGGGLGAGIARVCAREGASVIVADIDGDAASKVAAGLAQARVS